MKWIGITGTWRLTNEQVEADIRNTVDKIFQEGNGIVSGGALNADYFATDEAMKLNPTADRIKVFLPTTLATYADHYRKRAEEGVITQEQAEQLIQQLETLRNVNPAAVVENTKNTLIDEFSYYERNQSMVDASDELYAFQVNESAGVQDTIGKAKAKGIPVKLFSYTI